VIDPYIPYVLMGATTQAPTMFGFIYCMVFIEEKDTQVARIYGVAPISRWSFTILRLTLPLLIASLFTLITLLWQPFFQLGLTKSLLISLLTGLLAPILALTISALSKNKMEGMTWYKILNTIVTVPIVSYFVPKMGYLFGILPTYWAFEAFNEIMVSGLNISFLIATAYLLLLLLFVLNKHLKGHFTA